MSSPYVKIGWECGQLVADPWSRFGEYLSPVPEIEARIYDTWENEGVRNKGVYITGEPGTGKSTLGEIMAIQDIRSGKGGVYIDPHGEHALRLLDYVPAERVPDVIYLEPKDYPIPFSVMESTEDPDEREDLVNDLMGMLQRPDWGNQMLTILENCLYTLLVVPGTNLLNVVDLLAAPPLTLEDRRFVNDPRMNTQKVQDPKKRYLIHALRHVRDKTLKDFWLDQLPRYRQKESSHAIVRRFNQYLRSRYLNTMFAKGAKFTIHELMEQNKILIVNLHEIPPRAAQVIGTCLVTKIQQTIMRRPKDARTPFFLYVDELDQFAASPFSTIIFKCRKFNIQLTVMNQRPHQMKNADNREALLGIPTKVMFTLHGKDLNDFRWDLNPFTPEQAVGLRKHHAIFHSAITGSHYIRTSRAAPPREDEGRREEILRNMRELRVMHTSLGVGENLDLEEDDLDADPKRSPAIPDKV